jgi:hypothetical protein
MNRRNRRAQRRHAGTFTQAPPGYVAAIRKMALAAVDWVESRGVDGLAFSLPPDDGLMFIAPLSVEAIAMLASNEKSREFLKALDAAASEEGTAFQACQIIRAMELPIEDWSEAYWHSLLAEGAALVSRGDRGKA